MKVLWIFVSVVLATNAQVIRNYHEEVGIPLAARIKEAEDKMFAEGSQMQARVAGGEYAVEGEHPYLVGLIISLNDNRTSMCAASLVSDHHLVTIAQCMVNAKEIEAVLGSLYLYRGGTRLKTSTYKIHPFFNASVSFDYDVAKILLPETVTFSDTIQMVYMPTVPEETEVIGEWGVAAGWGLTSDSVYFLSTNTQVSHVRLKLIPEEVCKNRYRVSFVEKNNICTTGNGGVGMCKGDAGAPLVVTKMGLKILTGISSYGPKLCEESYPDAFTRMETYWSFTKRWELPLNDGI